MRQTRHTSALLKPLRAWQKTVLTQLCRESGDLSQSLSALPDCPNGNSSDFDRPNFDRLTRHLILILLVLRILELQSPGTLPGSTSAESLAQLWQSEPAGKPESNRLYLRLVNLWRSIQPQFVGLPIALELMPDLPLPDRLLRSMLDLLYLPAHQACLSSSSLLGQVYETLLANVPFSRSSQRKSQGIYYTPAAIVQFMVRQTLDELLVSDGFAELPWARSPDFPPSFSPNFLPRLLDPACGSGAFLLEAYQVLLDWQRQQWIDRFPGGHDGLIRGSSDAWQLSWAARQQILRHCIYGVDLDPEAVSITQLSLWLKLLEGAIDRDEVLPDLRANLQVGNAFLGQDAIDPAALPGQAIANSLADSLNPLDWEVAFPAILQSGGFDAVIGNPPYLDSEQMTRSCPTWRTYCTGRYQTAIGNWDLFCVFIEKALMLCRSGGITSLIVPNKLASAPYAAPARSLLMGQRLRLLRDYAQVPLFGASVYPLVYVAQKDLPPQTPVRYEVMAGLEQVQRSGWLSRNASPEASWQLAESSLQAEVMDRLQQLPTLESIAQVYGAATVSEAYTLQSWLQECESPEQEDFRLINSGTIDRYALLWGKKPTRYLGQTYQHPILRGDRLLHLPLRRQQQVKQPKILVAGLSQQLECALDAGGSLLAGKSTCIILNLIHSIDWRYLLALLNSRLLTGYFRYRSGSNQLQGGYLRVGTAQLKPLPIYLPDFTQTIDRALYAEILDLTEQRMVEPQTKPRSLPELEDFTNKNREIDLMIDRRIQNLYRLTDEEVAAITHTSFQQG